MAGAAVVLPYLVNFCGGSFINKNIDDVDQSCFIFNLEEMAHCILLAVSCAVIAFAAMKFKWYAGLFFLIPAAFQAYFIYISKHFFIDWHYYFETNRTMYFIIMQLWMLLLVAVSAKIIGRLLKRERIAAIIIACVYVVLDIPTLFLQNIITIQPALYFKETLIAFDGQFAGSFYIDSTKRFEIFKSGASVWSFAGILISAAVFLAGICVLNRIYNCYNNKRQSIS